MPRTCAAPMPTSKAARRAARSCWKASEKDGRRLTRIKHRPVHAYGRAREPARARTMPARMNPPHPLLHTGPSVGFDQPFEMLAACHARMDRSLDLLGRLGRHLHDQGCDAQARSAATDVLRYFDIAAPLHH